MACFVTNDPSIQDIILINVVHAMGFWRFNNDLIIETIMIEFFLVFSTLLEKFQAIVSFDLRYVQVINISKKKKEKNATKSLLACWEKRRAPWCKSAFGAT